jgi:ubiquitin-like modifier-activating enzyme ATG7
VVFALTDSREARWLPTVQCAAHDKLLINAALGFDSYLVMRHGHGGPEVASGDASSGPQSEMMGNASAGRLGCYFCMDVIGPGNSQRDRTLDQQCTVTRPGLAQIASGLAAELMVALLHSPLRQRTPALMPGSSSTQATDGTGGDQDNEGCEPLPHQIRGVLGKFTQVNPVVSDRLVWLIIIFLAYNSVIGNIA